MLDRIRAERATASLAANGRRRKTVIEPMLGLLLPADEHGRIASDFIPLWERLNRVVHPSWELRDRLLSSTALAVADNFDAAWAAEVLSDAATVFDLIWLAVLHRFPDCRGLLVNDTTFSHCPLSRAFVSAGHESPVSAMPDRSISADAGMFGATLAACAAATRR